MDAAPYFIVILLALSPISEVRLAIPAGIGLGLNPVVVFAIAFAVSSTPALLLIYGLSFIEEKLLQIVFPKAPRLRSVYDAVIARARSKAERVRRHRYVYLALAGFVAVPSPGTGVWTGSLVAYVLGLDKKKSVLSIIAGNLGASLLVLLVSLGVLTLVT